MTIIKTRLNEKEKHNFEKVKEIFQIPKGKWGEDSEAIKKSFISVIEMEKSFQLYYEDFKARYPLHVREYIKKRLNEV